MHISKKLAVVAVGLLALAGCTQQAPGTANGVSTPPSAASSSSASGAVAPAVKTPLSVSKFAADPCAALTQQQLAALGSTTPGNRNDLPPSVACHFELGGGAGVGVTFYPTITTGLTWMYEKRAAGDYGFFEPSEVDGFPAVQMDIADLRARGNCGMAVGVSNEAFFDVHIQGPAGRDACKAATNVAKAVLATIKGG